MHKTTHTPLDRVSAALDKQPVFPLPRGELWLGRELFRRAGMRDTVDDHFRLAERLGQDLVCLPVAPEAAETPDLGYRYFAVGDLDGAVARADRFVAAVVDGPFQCLVNRMGLMAVLVAWIRDRRMLVDAFAARRMETLALIRRCLDQGVHGVVVADDLAAEQGPMISPPDIQCLCGLFYAQATEMVHAAGARVLLHSCGNITRIIPLVRSWGVDGLAAVQNRVNELADLRRVSGWHGSIMAGIDADLLESDSPPPAALDSFQRMVTVLAPAGGLILGSCCGIYRGEFLTRIANLYALADRLVNA